MDKSPDAFRTISEVAEALETPAHVLRFWESRFPQIRPVKRAGGRRYYRPADVALLTGIKRLLHDEGLTIRGVQKILREQGIRHVSGQGDNPSEEEAALEMAMPGLFDADDDTTPEEAAQATAEALEAALGAPAVVVPFPGLEAVPGPAAEDPAAPELATPEPATPEPATPEPSTPEPAVPELAAPELAAPEPAVPQAADVEPAAIAADDVGAPVLRVTAVTGGALQRDEPTATPAARLRALPRTSLTDRRADLSALRARVAALRERMSGPPAVP